MTIHKKEIKDLSVIEILFLSHRCEVVPQEWLAVKSKEELMDALHELSSKGIISVYLDSSAVNLPSDITDKIPEELL